MDKQSLTPITEAAEKQLELRKQFISDYSNQLTVFFTDKIKSAFYDATIELENKHKELLQQSKEMLQNQNLIILKPEEPTEKMCNKQNGNE